MKASHFSRYAQAVALVTLVFGCQANVDCGNCSVTGTLSPGMAFNSTAFRSLGTTPLALNAESTLYAGQDLPAGFREVPDINQDNDGSIGALGVLTRPVDRTGWNATTCGTSGSIPSRISDCATTFGSGASWDGTQYGLSGEGLWNLVVRKGPSQEIWRDGRTGLLWSSKIVNALGDNWCRASGNSQAVAACNNLTLQPELPSVESDCAEFPGSVPVPGWCSDGHFYATAAACTGAGGTWTANSENWGTATYSAAKGGLGKTSTPSVRWRLPTRNDLQLADIDGLRFVIADTGGGPSGSNYNWTATAKAADHAFAWTFDDGGGGIAAGDKGLALAGVRCVGR